MSGKIQFNSRQSKISLHMIFCSVHILLLKSFFNFFSFLKERDSWHSYYYLKRKICTNKRALVRMGDPQVAEHLNYNQKQLSVCGIGLRQRLFIVQSSE